MSSSVTKAVCFTCSQQCGLLAHMTGSKVTRLVGDRDHPRTAGFVCPKGSRAHELHDAPDRIHRPQRRIGPRGSGRWETITWEEALGDIAGALEKVAATSGPESVAHGFGTLHGSDYAIGRRFMNLFGSPNSVGQDKICFGPTVLGEFLTYGFGYTTMASPVPGVTNCLVVWGQRPKESARPAWQAMEKALAAGTQLLVIDPERTEEARKADLWLQLEPGTDAALGLALLQVLIENGLYAKDFVGSQTVGFEALRERVAEYPPEKVASVTGVPADQIRRAALMIAADAPSFFAAGNGLCQSGTSTVQNGRVLACLIAVTGNLNRQGGHGLAGPPRDILGNADWMAADSISPAQRAKVLGGESLPSIGDGYEQLDAAIASAWYGKRGIADSLAYAHEPTLWRAILEEDPYPVRALLLQYHNPVGASANVAQVEAALTSEKLELLVSHDLFLNATSRLADYVLPAAHWLEKPYFSLGAAYIAAFGDYAEACHATLEAEHEHRSDYDLWRDLGHRLGQGDRWPDTAEAFYQTLLDPAGLNFDELAVLDGPVTGEAARHPENRSLPPSSRFGTPSGKVELSCSLLENWGEDPLPHFSRPKLFEMRGDYPLVLTTGGRQIEGFHQNAQQLAIFRKKNPEPFVTMRRETAERYGVEDGEWVRVETPIGSVQQQVRISDRLAIGVVQADRWWYPEGTDDADDPFGVRRTNINMCTSNATGDVDPIMGTWLMRGLPCRLVASDTVLDAPVL